MATVAIYDQDRKQIGERELVDSVFNTEVKEYLLHDMVRYQLAAKRQGTACVKTEAQSQVVARNRIVRRGPVTRVRELFVLLTS